MIQFTDEIRTAVNHALVDRCPMLLSYVDADGQPSLSFRGSTQTHGEDCLAIWVRNPEGGLLRAIGTNPRIALLYRNPETRLAWMFQGRASVREDAETRERVYNEAPEGERNLDLERKGKALVIELDRIHHRVQVLMQREDAPSSI